MNVAVRSRFASMLFALLAPLAMPGVAAAEPAACEEEAPIWADALETLRALADPPAVCDGAVPLACVDCVPDEAPGLRSGRPRSGLPGLDVLPELPVTSAPDGDRLLFYSDSPEEPAREGVLYRDLLPAGDFRVYLYHANGRDAGEMRFPVVVENPGIRPITVEVEGEYIAAPGTAYHAIGRDVARAMLAPAGAPRSIEVPPGGMTLLVPALGSRGAAPGELVHAVVDARSSGPVRVWSVALHAESAGSLERIRRLAPLPRDANHQRGTFPGADRRITTVGGCALDPARVHRLRLGAHADGVPIPAGRDALTGDPMQLKGHYGIRYTLDLPLHGAGTSRVLLNPRGGAYAGGIRLGDGTPIATPTAEPTAGYGTGDDLVVVGDLAGGSARLVWTAPGASNLPVDLLFVPSPTDGLRVTSPSP